MNEELTKLTFTCQAIFQKTYGWYEFRQNNSGGSFQIDDDVTIYVLIQAASAKEANIKAEEIGIYFDGCYNGHDCNCCGDRWYEASDPMDSFITCDWENNHLATDHTNIRDYAQAVANGDSWVDKGEPPIILYFLDGTVERFYKNG